MVKGQIKRQGLSVFKFNEILFEKIMFELSICSGLKLNVT